MANKPAVSNGPIEITDNFGKQLSIPLSALYFDSAGSIKADHWPTYSATPSIQPAVNSWLGYLVDQGLLSPGAAPAPVPAFQLQARDAGSNGNFITVSFTNIAPAAKPADTKVDASVTETDTYTFLSPSTISGVLGASAGTGTRPGLVFLASKNPSLPVAGSGVLAGNPPQFVVPGAFTLQGVHSEADATLTTVTIQDVDASAQTFTLIVSWQKSATGVKLSDLDGQFKYVVDIIPPAGGFTVPPAAGVVTLAGGTDPVSITPSQARATVVGNS